MPRTVSSRASIHSVRSVSKTKDPCTRGRDDGDDVAREKTGLDAVLKLGLMRACSAHNAKKIASATAECVTTTPLYARSCKRAPQHRKRLVPSRQEASMSSSSAHPQTHTPRRRIARRGRASRSGASGLRAKARRGAALSSAATSASRRPGSRRGTITSWAVPGLGHPRPSGRRELGLYARWALLCACERADQAAREPLLVEPRDRAAARRAVHEGAHVHHLRTKYLTRYSVLTASSTSPRATAVRAPSDCSRWCETMASEYRHAMTSCTWKASVCTISSVSARRCRTNCATCSSAADDESDERREAAQHREAPRRSSQRFRRRSTRLGPPTR